MSLPDMNGCRDLRNKILIFEENLYVIGGNMCTGERFSFKHNKWIPLKDFGDILNDNLVAFSQNNSFPPKLPKPAG